MGEASNTVARQIVHDTVRSAFRGLGVVFSSGPVFRRTPTRRNRRQTKELSRLLEVVSSIEQAMRVDRDADAATAIAVAEGFDDCITVVTSTEQLIAAIAVRLSSGDNVWDAHAVGDIVRVGLWHDQSHPRIE